MRIEDLLTEAHRQGVELWAEGNQLHYRTRGALPAYLRTQLVERKAELLPILADQYERARAIARNCEATGTDLAAYVAACPDLLNEPTLTTSPAESLIGTCQRYGVALHLDADGRLLVGKAGTKQGEAGYAWPSLLQALEAHCEAVAALVRAGWTLQADFPTQAAA